MRDVKGKVKGEISQEESKVKGVLLSMANDNLQTRYLPEQNLRVLIPKQEVKRLYVEEGLNLTQIAKMFRCSADTVKRRLKSMNIPIRSRNVTISDDEMLAMFNKYGGSVRSLARHFDCSRATIKNRLYKLGLEYATTTNKPLEEAYILRRYKDGDSIKSIAEATKVSRRRIKTFLIAQGVEIRTKSRKTELPKEEIVYLYENSQFTVSDVSQIYKVGEETVAMHLKADGCRMRGNRVIAKKSEIINKFNETKSIKETALYFNCSYSTIRTRLIKFGIWKVKSKKQ